MFKVKGKAQLRAINVSKGNQDESPVCVTLSLVIEGVDKEAAAAALGCEVDQVDYLFTESGEGRYHGVEQITSWATYENTHILSMMNFKHDIRKISSLKFKPVGGRQFNLSMNVQIQEPNENFLPKLAEHIHGDVTVSVEPSNELDL